MIKVPKLIQMMKIFLLQPIEMTILILWLILDPIHSLFSTIKILMFQSIPVIVSIWRNIDTNLLKKTLKIFHISSVCDFFCIISKSFRAASFATRASFLESSASCNAILSSSFILVFSSSET